METYIEKLHGDDIALECAVAILGACAMEPRSALGALLLERTTRRTTDVDVGIEYISSDIGVRPISLVLLGRKRRGQGQRSASTLHAQHVR